MKHQVIKDLAVALAGITTLFATQPTASAASQYSAKRSHEVKLIWRKAMGRHAFTAPTGARFSKHLGTRYGYNTETANVAWYTDAHEKLYLKNLNMYSIYYHVTNSDQSLQGWIWKGYLKPANDDSTSAGSDGSSNANNDNSSPDSTMNLHYDTDGINEKIIQLFPGLTEDSKLDHLAAYSIWIDEHRPEDSATLFPERLVKLYGGDPKGLLEEKGGVPEADINTLKKQVEDPLNVIEYSNLSQYAGYHIGVASYPTSFTTYTNSGSIHNKFEYEIYICPANPTINPSTYKPN
ncbi:hypothetical protein ACFQ22_01880 [Lentilactobacillus raoultii]|uniref:D-alanyl-D-alanine carboxypeptidase n=1 Tax=Lentilactobacillus raoultii TaxID=1987503 RepID=A0ABW3PL46_9LACO|nr:hypothetical protein [Lentilactobacillus raoultii]